MEQTRVLKKKELERHIKQGPDMNEDIFNNALIIKTSPAEIIAHFKRREGPKFFISEKLKSEYRSALRNLFPQDANDTIAQADRYLDHTFDLLGSGPKKLSDPLPWHEDFKTGFKWPKIPTLLIKYKIWDKDIPYDIKIPWELSRAYHFITLGQAYLYTNDDKYAREFVKQAKSWTEENPVGYGINWKTTMEAGIRVINWIWAYYFFCFSPDFSDEEQYSYLANIYAHGLYISRHLEFGPVLGNHFFSDVVGLLYAAVFLPEVKESQKWLKEAKKYIFQEIIKQFEPDGANFEQSTAYHRLVLELSLSAVLLLQINGHEIPKNVKERLHKALLFTAAITKPDGRVPVIGDADDGRAHIFSEATRKNINDHRYLLCLGAIIFEDPQLKKVSSEFWPETIWLGGRESLDKYNSLTQKSFEPLITFEKSGFYALHGNQSKVIIHAGEVGQRGWGGHSHNDQFSFEYFHKSNTYIIDSGPYVYTSEPEERNKFRSTRAHNTLMIDNQEINRFKGRELFALENDSSCRLLGHQQAEQFSFIDLSHSAYRRLKNSVILRRQFYLDKKTGSLLIKDIIKTEGNHKIELNLHFNCEVEIKEISPHIYLARKDQEQISIILPGGFEEKIVNGFISPSYGIKRESKRLILSTIISGSSEFETYFLATGTKKDIFKNQL